MPQALRPKCLRPGFVAFACARLLAFRASLHPVLGMPWVMHHGTPMSLLASGHPTPALALSPKAGIVVAATGHSLLAATGAPCPASHCCARRLAATSGTASEAASARPLSPGRFA
jgi:hypothetical protein